MKAKNNPAHLRLSLSSSRPIRTSQLSRHTYLLDMEGGGVDFTTCCPMNIFTCTRARGHMFTAVPCLLLFLRIQIQNQTQLSTDFFLFFFFLPTAQRLFISLLYVMNVRSRRWKEQSCAKLSCVIFFFFSLWKQPCWAAACNSPHSL